MSVQAITTESYLAVTKTLNYLEYKQENTNVELGDTEWAPNCSQYNNNKPECYRSQRYYYVQRRHCQLSAVK